MTKEQSSDTKKEEIRGLFVLGLLAVLASIRVQYSTLTVTIGQTSLNVSVFLDFTIVLWSFYAFFMVFAFSGDMLGETISAVCKDVAKMFLQLNFVVLSVLGLVYGFSAYPTRMPWAFVLVGILLGFQLINRVRTRKRKPVRLNLRESLKSSISPILMLVLSLCIVFIILGSSDQYVLPSFVVGCLAIVALFIVRLRVKKQAQTKL